MRKIQIETLLQEADHMLDLAREELNRAKEDVIAHRICVNTRTAIANYLKVYLIRKDIPVPPTTNLEALQTECIMSDEKFTNLDLTSIDCRFDSEGKGYCSNINKIEHCFMLANQSRALCDVEKWPESLHVK